jgi:predicted DNA-binding transcriptional regulator AlpA
MMTEHVKVSRQFLNEHFERLAELIVHNNVHLLGVNDVAHMMGISPVTFRNYLSQGKLALKPVKIGGRTLFRRKDVEAFIESL